ncbi:MAG TPA: hypothetical protein VFG41_08460 [Sphingomicrobium sp.]|jgi:hypothetical protein|nr:hypothetical protein [Sphingomicrobium sp.]
MSESESERRRRWVNLGEIIAIAALIVSALGVWIAWRSSSEDKPTRIVEQRQPIPLTLRAKREDDGSTLQISPVESSHALESLKITLPGASPIEVGSDGELDASDVESALKGRDEEPKDRTVSVPVRIDARYVEMGKERRTSGTYILRYMWKGGGLFGGRSLHLVSLSR